VGKKEEKLRLGGMALTNGVLVHGPTSWACAVRTPEGELKVASAYKKLRAAEVEQRLLRGPARLVDAVAVLPAMKRKLPEAKLPFERPAVMGVMLASAVAARTVKGSARITPLAQELVAGLLSLAPTVYALRGSELAAYHGAEHISIGTYEHGERREKEHERCGSHVVGPLIATSAVGGVLASKAPRNLRPLARISAAFGALAASTEIFAWMVRHPDNPVSKALAKPGHEIQHRLATAEPAPEQLEVAEAALQACLELEHAAGQNPA
jgi:uncharacterized protein YqhQ